jgi:predicted transglutaminase-like cysteine proteinase
MVSLAISATPRQNFRVPVIFSFIITGLAVTCAAVPLTCFSLLTVLSTTLKAGDHQPVQSRLPSALPLLRSDLEIDTTASLASVPGEPQQGTQFISFESRFLSAQPLLRSDVETTAGLGRIPIRPRQDIQTIRFDVPTLAPMAFTQFCLRYPGDCEQQQFSFGGDRIELDKARWSELETVNRTVNSSIHPERNNNGLAGEKWLLNPVRGDCNDYAVTKRHQLIARGWPSRTVLLSEVVTVSGEHHLVTVVRTNSGDLVLDNLTDQIVPWSRAHYRWVRIQTPKNPNYWASISGQTLSQL